MIDCVSSLWRGRGYAREGIGHAVLQSWLLVARQLLSAVLSSLFSSPAAMADSSRKETLVDYTCIFNQRAQSYIKASVKWSGAREHEFAAYLDNLDLKPGERFLDVPCGTGIVGTLTDARVNYLGLDPSAPFVAYCQAQGTPVLQASMRTTGLPDASFDVIGSLSGVHHEDDRLQLYREWFRLLRPGGRLLVMDVWRGSAVGEFLNGFVAEWNSAGHDGCFLSEADSCWLEGAGFTQVASTPLEYAWQAASVQDMSSFMCELFGLEVFGLSAGRRSMSCTLVPDGTIST